MRVMNRLTSRLIIVFRNALTQTFDLDGNSFHNGIAHFKKFAHGSAYTENTLQRLKRGPPWNVLFFGTDNFAVASLKELHSETLSGNLIQRLDVVTVRLKKIKPAVSSYCEKQGLNLELWPVQVPHGKYDLGVVVSFGHLLPQAIIEAFPLGILNVHGSLLPRWRGAAPIMHAIMNGDTITGVTIMKIHPHRFDVGEIVCKTEVPISWNSKSGDLTRQIAEVGSKALVDVLKNLENTFTMAVPQPNTGITKAPKMTEQRAKIDWAKVTCYNVQCLYRALDDNFPLWTTWHGNTVKLREMVMKQKYTQEQKYHTCVHNDSQCSNENEHFKTNSKYPKGSDVKLQEETIPGAVIYCKRTKVLRVCCVDGWVEFRKVHVKGRKPMTAHDFYNGFISKRKAVDHVFG
ncbi:methionyl-tRNA formyltransferase, mitochondrial isoform X1 [Oratosquilla oratoria]|uniref:methionyl-tRNA formyltransferase, mitochondrial isoform X1 n=1 Tax=Oratosquilla oratoria TaxID=337810 RepID=UPI003F76B25C